jgi:hypothetical protein
MNSRFSIRTLQNAFNNSYRKYATKELIKDYTLDEIFLLISIGSLFRDRTRT